MTGRVRGSGRTSAAVAAMVLVLVALTGCEATIASRINDGRAMVGRPALPRARYLDEAAKAKSQAMCTARAEVATPNPTTAYAGEQAVEVWEGVDSEPLDMSLSDPWARDGKATDAMLARANGDPAQQARFVDARWDDMGIGQATCPDGKLYMTVLLRDRPALPAGGGRFATYQYTDAQIAVTNGLVYRQARRYDGVMVDLALDVYVPPTAGGPALRPAVVLVHGGGFQGGTRDHMIAEARTYARTGYVAISISYRLRPSGSPLLETAADAIDDAMEAVRWVRSQAGTYKIDTTRIGIAGVSAGGAIALGVSLTNDPTPTGPLAAFSPTVAAGISTGAHLTPGLGLPIWDFDRAPVLMANFAVDEVDPDAPKDYFYETCAATRAGGGSCDYREIAGTGHTIAIGPSGTYWSAWTGPFMYRALRLGSL